MSQVVISDAQLNHKISMKPADESSDFDMTQLLLLGKVEYDGGPIFKVVLEC